jgi:tetratricopeptide (TPR) repeat protein
MSMKKTILAIAAIALCAAAAAQTTTEEFQARYERLVRNVGYSGVGVETLIDRWEEAFPDDANPKLARFNYYYDKALHTEIVAKPGMNKFLGNPPSLTLKDADGQDIPYFEEQFFDEAPFGEAMRVLDAQIAAQPDDLRWRHTKISALCAYEKESPDMAARELNTLIDGDSKHAAWTLDGAPADADMFQQFVGEFCADFFRLGTDAGYEYFREISELMSKRYPKNPAFIDNIGSYWQVAKGNDRQATKYYQKALKLDPNDYAATQNLRLIERKKAAAKK